MRASYLLLLGLVGFACCTMFVQALDKPTDSTPTGDTPIGDTPTGDTPTGDTPIYDTPIDSPTEDDPSDPVDTVDDPDTSDDDNGNQGPGGDGNDGDEDDDDDSSDDDGDHGDDDDHDDDDDEEDIVQPTFTQDPAECLWYAFPIEGAASETLGYWCVAIVEDSGDATLFLEGLSAAIEEACGVAGATATVTSQGYNIGTQCALETLDATAAIPGPDCDEDGVFCIMDDSIAYYGDSQELVKVTGSIVCAEQGVTFDLAFTVWDADCAEAMLSVTPNALECNAELDCDDLDLFGSESAAVGLSASLSVLLAALFAAAMGLF